MIRGLSLLLLSLASAAAIQDVPATPGALNAAVVSAVGTCTHGVPIVLTATPLTFFLSFFGALLWHTPYGERQGCYDKVAAVLVACNNTQKYPLFWADRAGGGSHRHSQGGAGTWGCVGGAPGPLPPCLPPRP